MFSGKQLLATILGLVVATVAVLNHSEKRITENYWGDYPMTSVLANNEGLYDQTVENYNNNNSKGFFTVPGKYQSQLSPRFSNTGYGSVRYHLPAKQVQAVPVNPLTVANTVENFEQQSKPSNKPLSKLAGPLNLPVSNMENKRLPMNPIMYNNLMFSSKRDRLYAQGDPIRGDLPIQPCTDRKNRWFLPSANPQTALRSGALQVMGGFDANSSVSNLKMLASGGSVTTNSGVNMQRPKNSFLSQIGNQLKGQNRGNPTETVAFTSFP